MKDQFDLKIPSFKLWKNSDKNIPTSDTRSYGMFNVSKRDIYGNNGGDVPNTILLPTSPTNRILYNEIRPFSISNEPQTMSLDIESPRINDNTSSSRDTVPYNYRPFFGNRVVSQSKIDALKETEVTEHCLIFHKDVEHDIDFRPDLCLNCGQDKYNHNIYNTNRNNRNNEDSEKETTNRLNGIEKRYRLKKESCKVTKTHFSSNFSINLRGVLEKFWKGSDLLNSLDPNILEMVSAIVWDESEEIYKTQLHLNHEDGSSSDQDTSKSTRLRRNYQRALAKASYIQRSSK